MARRPHHPALRPGDRPEPQTSAEGGGKAGGGGGDPSSGRDAGDGSRSSGESAGGPGDGDRPSGCGAGGPPGCSFPARRRTQRLIVTNTREIGSGKIPGSPSTIELRTHTLPPQAVDDLVVPAVGPQQKIPGLGQPLARPSQGGHHLVEGEDGVHVVGLAADPPGQAGQHLPLPGLVEVVLGVRVGVACAQPPAGIGRLPTPFASALRGPRPSAPRVPAPSA